MSAQTERLREKHRAAVLQIKTALPPGHPKRYELLVGADELARRIRQIERANEK